MRAIAAPLVSFLAVVLAGCSSTEAIVPVKTTQTAAVHGDAASIYWLDEKQTFPETLSEIVLLGDYGQYQSEYRWRRGVVREIQRTGTVLDDGELKEQSVLIRYDSEGQAVYQQYRLDGDLLPIRGTELVKYYRQAEQALASAKALGKEKQDFFQGHWKAGTFEECGSSSEKTLTFDTVLPDYLLQSLDQPSNFLAAVGEVGRKSNTVNEVIILGDGETPCLVRPEFKR
ncbi:DUF1481 domain-containing protein [Enterovibrio nigricans]|uniref:Peptidylprolyl isomerase n=1 Tax=Enterovibrio nigricans DSM 22720 TaxID=1121868 RepID=A0A1T4UF40_9GAMM|nr:DUF1481 domain-containing protein [Enterovibrio nigricans]PKF51131.1 DUF1481 domain-containing protein [Enterovibrio nigricans]SKA51304.1 Protein of unknown function [Enterovibrio nigricans DSM 22720]